MKEVFGYATDLRSITQGRAAFTLKFSHYDVCDQTLQRYIIEKTKGFIPEFMEN